MFIFIFGCTGSSSRVDFSVVVSRGLLFVGVHIVVVSLVMEHGLSCYKACGIFLDQRGNQCPLHWQEDSYPLYNQGSPLGLLINSN